MLKDIEGIERFACGYSKINNEHDEQLLMVEYLINDIDINTLRKIFNVSKHESDPIKRDLIKPFDIDSIQAKYIQKFVKNGIIDTEKFDFVLETVQKKGYDWSNGYVVKINDK